MEQNLEFSSELLTKYDSTGPRYTSYPTALQFNTDFDQSAYQQIAQKSTETNQPKPLSLYFHIPFCDTICYYCGCSKIVTRDHTRSTPYLNYLKKELILQAKHFDQRKVSQLHWGGGTPTFLNEEQITRLMNMTSESFILEESDDREFSIEIDPRSVDTKKVSLLAEVGFNRLSLGVQDFDPHVQKAVNRIQSKQQTIEIIEHSRKVGFKSVSIDLIYGLPLQTVESFSNTLNSVLNVRPDRIAVYSYAHMPHLFKTQRGIHESELPNSDQKLALLSLTISKLTDAGYIYIGMDHFALPDDELSIAQRSGTLHRNFQGYSTHADCDLIGLGMTSIGKVGNSYSQNMKQLDSYYQCLDDDKLAVYRGIELSNDDIIRRAIISELMCHSMISFQAIENKYDIQFKDYFKHELEQLNCFIDDGLLRLKNGSIEITPVGRMLTRNIAMLFDAYRRPTLVEKSEEQKTRYSRLI